MAKQTFTVGQVLTADQMTSLQQTAMGGGSAERDKVPVFNNPYFASFSVNG